MTLRRTEDNMNSRQPSRNRQARDQSPEQSPNNLINVTTLTGQQQEIRHQEGHILVCEGCCCGNTEKGFPAVSESKRGNQNGRLGGFGNESISPSRVAWGHARWAMS